MIIDGFIFYNELDILELRLRELYDVVDWFVLVEATRTFRGDEKPLFFEQNRDRYTCYLKKIIHIIVEDMPMNTDAWGREKHQRNAIKRGVDILSPSMDSILLLSDVDEIPDSSIVSKLNPDSIYTLEQDFYYYDYTWKHRDKWTSAKVLPIKDYVARNCDADQIRLGTGFAPKIKYAGWHFSYFGNTQFIRNKIESFSHQEYNFDKYKDPNHLDECIKLGKDLFFRHDKKLTRVPITLNPYLPRSVKRRNVAFFIRQFSERGTEVSIYDYAHYNETLLGNDSIIIGLNSRVFVQGVLDKFRKRFRVILLDSFSEVDSILRNEGIDVYYTQTHGAYEKYPFGDVTACKYVVHCVFETRQPHGDVYCAISQQLNERFNTSVPVVPYIVPKGKTTDTFRSTLNIPDNAIVFGRHGGLETFDLQCAQDAVVHVASQNPSIYFLFMNTQPFCHLQNVIHLPLTTDIEEKQKFINTCDAYLHGRRDGETFGLSIGEFAVCDKPIIACEQCTDNAHLRILGDKIYKYKGKDDLIEILCKFQRDKIDMTHNGYKQFTPETVMNIFNNVILQP